MVNRRIRAGGIFASGAFMALAAFGSASAWSVSLPAHLKAAPVSSGGGVRPLVFSRLAVHIPQGRAYAKVEQGAFCTAAPDKTWSGSTATGRPPAPFASIFSREAAIAGVAMIAEDNSNLFEAASTAAGEYEIGAAITDLQEEFCVQGSAAKGAVRIGVEWQVYSRLQGKVVARFNTTGGAERKSTAAYAAVEVVDEAFDQNVIALLSNRDFIAAVSRAPSVNDQPAPASSSLAPMTLAATSLTVPVSDSVGSVVSVFTGEGFGSAWVVADGYIMTDRHVVGEASAVRVEWPDQVHAQGVVVRSDRRRDVALIRTDTRGRPPLGVRFEPLRPGETVFAVGTPLDLALQGSVTRGVVSGLRTFSGLAFVQSDVMVNRGDSGGPLLDDQGRVVGMSELGLQINGAPSGLNLFTPIRDAFDFLQLQIAPQAQPRTYYASAGRGDGSYPRPSAYRRPTYVPDEDRYGGYARPGPDPRRPYVSNEDRDDRDDADARPYVRSDGPPASSYRRRESGYRPSYDPEQGRVPAGEEQPAGSWRHSTPEGEDSGSPLSADAPGPDAIDDAWGAQAVEDSMSTFEAAASIIQ